MKKQILDDFELLELMVQDSKNLNGIYKPGPYWENKIQSSLYELKNKNLNDFRGTKNGVLTSYGDNAFVDTRITLNFGIHSLFGKLLRTIYPFNILFDAQVSLTSHYFLESIKYQNIYFQNNDRVKYLLAKYPIDFDTTLGGCLSFGNFNGINISHHYLQLLDTLDNVDLECNIRNKKAFFEIGGGYGVNTHLIIELFNVRKIIYLDIPPNLYVGTQYLKSFYGNSVIDYKISRNLESIKFSDTNELEIFCITPQQIEQIKSKIDFFHNAHSFVEMPEYIVKNYAEKIQSLLSDNSPTISLVSYDGFDTNTTFNPEILPNFFKKSAKKSLISTLTPARSNYHFIIK